MARHACHGPRVSAPGSAKDGGCHASSPSEGSTTHADRCDPALVTAPPYDVLDDRDRAALAAADPANVVVIDLPVDGDDPYATAGEHAAEVAGRRRAGPRRAAVLLRLPHDLRRRDRRPPPHHRGVRRARAEPARRGRHPAPRAHDPEGQERPAQPAARHRRQPLAGVGPLPRRRALRPARRRRAHRCSSGPTTPASPTSSGSSTTPTGSRPSAPRSPARPVVIADGHHRYETVARLPRRAARRRPRHRRRHRARGRADLSWSSWSTTSSPCCRSTGSSPACPTTSTSAPRWPMVRDRPAARPPRCRHRRPRWPPTARSCS